MGFSGRRARVLDSRLAGSPVNAPLAAPSREACRSRVELSLASREGGFLSLGL